MKTLKLVLCKLFLLAIFFNGYSQEHPFLIVKESQYPALREKWKSGEQPFKMIRNVSMNRWNNGLKPKEQKNKHLESIAEVINYNIVAYIVDTSTANKTKYRNRILELINTADTQLSMLKSNGSHGVYMNGASALFNQIIALDIIYNDISTSQRNKAEANVAKLVNFYESEFHKRAWKLADYGISLLYAIYKNNKKDIDYWKDKYDNYLFKKSLTSDGSWGQSPGYVYARIHGSRLAKCGIIDVLQHTGNGDYYNDSRMKSLFEWSNTFAVTPFGSFTKFGDAINNGYELNKRTNLFYSNKYGATIAGMTQWNNNGTGNTIYHTSFQLSNYMVYILRDNKKFKPIMPISKLKKQSGAALWDRTNSREALQGVLYNLKRDTPNNDQFGHTMEDVNSFSIAGYGQHMIMNPGGAYTGKNNQGSNYPGYTPNNDRWFLSKYQNTVLIGNATTHAERHGNGLVDGLVGGKIEFGTTDAGPAINNGSHLRTLHFIHPEGGKSNGYFVVYDEVKPKKSSDKVNIQFQINTKRNGTKVVKANQEYHSPINSIVYTNFSAHDKSEKVNLFFASDPKVSIVDSYKGAQIIADRKTDNVRAQYQTKADGYVRATTVIFPEDKEHKKPPIAKISNTNYSGAIVSHNNNFKDYYIGASPSKENTYNKISFKASTTFYRKESGKTTKFSSTNGTKFRDAEGVGYGYQASQAVSIVLENNSGNIYAKKNANVTFYKQSITGIKVNGSNANVVSSASNSVTVTIPAGRHKIELIIGGTPPVVANPRPPANLTNGDYFIETPTGGTRIKNSTGATVSISTGSGNDAKWTITKISGSDYTLKNVQTGRYLEVPYGACNAGDKPQNPNVNLGTYTQVVADHLRWNITKVGNDYFLEPLHCEKVADRNNGNTMHLWPYQNGNENQNWKIVSVNQPVNEPPTLSFLRPTETTFTVGDDLVVEAKADDVDGTIAEVALYFDDKLVKKSPQSNTHIWWSKYDVLMTKLKQGEHTLKLIATDNLGATTEAVRTIFVRTTIDCSWIKQSGKADDIGANGSHVYLIGTNGYLYKSNGNGGWIIVDNTKKLKRLDVAPNGDVWAISTDNKVWQYALASKKWLDKKGTGIDIGVANNVFYILGLDNKVKKYTGNGTYTTLSSGRGKRIDVDGNGTPWLVGMNNGLYQWNGSGWNRKGSQTISDIGIEPDGTKVVVIGTNQKIYNYSSNELFEEVPGFATQITINSDGIPWIIDNNKEIYKRGCVIGERIRPETEKDFNNEQNINVYPNPITGKDFTIDLNSTDTSFIRIFDTQGRKIYQTKTKSQSIRIEKRFLRNAGLYFVKISQNKSSFVEKILVK